MFQRLVCCLSCKRRARQWPSIGWRTSAKCVLIYVSCHSSDGVEKTCTVNAADDGFMTFQRATGDYLKYFQAQCFKVEIIICSNNQNTTLDKCFFMSSGGHFGLPWRTDWRKKHPHASAKIPFLLFAISARDRDTDKKMLSSKYFIQFSFCSLQELNPPKKTIFCFHFAQFKPPKRDIRIAKMWVCKFCTSYFPGTQHAT